MVMMITHNEVKEYYDDRYVADLMSKVKVYQLREGVRPIDAYHKIIEVLGLDIGKDAGKKILDVGCGRGYFLYLAGQKGLETYGIDISSEGVELAKVNSHRSKLHVGPGEDLSMFKNNFFDYVVCLGSLEHFLEKDKALSEMYRVGKENCRYVIMPTNMNFILWKFKRGGTHQQNVMETLMPLEGWRALLERNKFKILEVLPDDYNFTIPIFKDHRPLWILRRLILRLIGYMIPLYYAFQFIFVCEKTNANVNANAPE